MTDHEQKKHIISQRNKVAKEIKAIRERRGYSQDYLAEILGVSRSTISKIENGKFSFSIDYVTKLSLVLNFSISIDELA